MISFQPIWTGLIALVAAGILLGTGFLWRAAIREFRTTGVKVHLVDGQADSLERGTAASVAALEKLSTIAAQGPKLDELNAHLEHLNGGLATLLAGQIVTDDERAANQVLAQAKIEADRIKAIAIIVAEALLTAQKKQTDNDEREQNKT